MGADLRLWLGMLGFAILLPMSTALKFVGRLVMMVLLLPFSLIVMLLYLTGFTPSPQTAASAGSLFR